MPDFLRRARIDPEKSEKMLLERVAPVYPDAALKEKLIGDVLLMVVVGSDGKVQRAHHLSGNPILAEAAEAAMKKWRYRPHLVEGLPIEFETEVRLKFPADSPKPKS